MLRAILTTLLVFFAVAPTAGAEVLSGSVSDLPDQADPKALDAERLTVTYDAALGRIDVEVGLHSPHAPNFNSRLRLSIGSARASDGGCLATRSGDVVLTNDLISDIEDSGQAAIVGTDEAVSSTGASDDTRDPVYAFTYQDRALENRGYLCVTKSSLKTYAVGGPFVDDLDDFVLSTPPPVTATPTVTAPAPTVTTASQPVATSPPSPDRGAVLGSAERGPLAFARRRQRASAVLANGLAVAVRCRRACRISATMHHRGRRVGRGKGRLSGAGVARIVLRVDRRKLAGDLRGGMVVRVTVGGSRIELPVRLLS